MSENVPYLQAIKKVDSMDDDQVRESVIAMMKATPEVDQMRELLINAISATCDENKDIPEQTVVTAFFDWLND